MIQRIGILGGTFDPPHLAHLVMGEYAVDALGLDKLLWVPAADPPHKQQDEKTPVLHRVGMLARAIADNAVFELSRVDIDRPGPHYSIETVRIIQQQYPSAQLYFIIGGDSLRDLLSWHQPDVLIERCRLGVVRRPDAPVDIHIHAAALPALAERITLIDAPLLGISSTVIRERLRTGRSVRYLVPAPVLTYIDEYHIYQS